MRVEPEHGENERSSAAPEVGDHLRVGKIPCFGDRGVVFRRSRAHDGTKDRTGAGVLRPAGRHCWITDLTGRLTGPNTLGEERPFVGKQVRPEDDRRPDRLRHIPAQRLAKRGQPKVFRRGLFSYADAGESAQQAEQGIGIRLTLLGQEANAAHLVSKRIGNAETCSGAEHAAARVRHRHLDKPGIRDDIADAAIGLGHKTPQKF